MIARINFRAATSSATHVVGPDCGPGSAIATISKAERMLEKAATIDEIRHVENLAQVARDYANKARLGRESVNVAARLALDARRKAGSTLKAMRERGELADGRKPKQRQSANQSHAAIVYTLSDLGLTNSQSSLYQQEASVPPDVYEKWVRRVIDSKYGVLSAARLRALARQISESDETDDSPLPFAEAERRIRRLVAKLSKQMDGDGRARLPELLESLSREVEADQKAAEAGRQRYSYRKRY